jgi:hypothetical protein
VAAAIRFLAIPRNTPWSHTVRLRTRDAAGVLSPASNGGKSYTLTIYNDRDDISTASAMPVSTTVDDELLISGTTALPVGFYEYTLWNVTDGRPILTGPLEVIRGPA